MNVLFNTKRLIKIYTFNLLANPLRIQNRINKIYSQGYLTIINLHRVANDDGSAYQPLCPKIFENLLQFLLKKFTIINFQGLQENKYSQNRLTKKPLLILSFDDGYKDFLTVAHPLLIKYGIRANQNIIPSCIENQRPPFNVVLQDYLGKTSIKEYRKLKIPNYSWNNNLSKIEEGIKLSSYIKNHTYQRQIEIEKCCYEQLGEKLYEYSTEMMNKSDISEIIKFHDIGLHSFFHSNMGCETDEFFKNDLNSCTRWFISNFGIKPFIYAFPNGSYKKSSLQIAKNKGYSQILLVNNNFSKIDESVHNRFGFHAFTQKEMIYKALGSLKRI